MDKRILQGSLCAAAVLLLCGFFTKLFGLDPIQAIETGIGAIPLIDVLAALLAMAVGAAIARHPQFRWAALLLMVLLWALTLATIVSLANPDSPEPMRTLVGALRYNAVAIVLSLAAAFGGALLGERIARRQGHSIG